MDNNAMNGGFGPSAGPASTPNPANNSTGGGFSGVPVAPSQPMMGATQMSAPNPVPAPVAPVESSSKKGVIIETIILILVCIIAGIAIVLAVMFYMKWDELNTDFEAKKSLAVAEAQKEMSDKYATDLQEALKRETAQFTGPDDFGRISFSYPKIWSVYEAEDGTQNSDYRAYFAPAPVASLEDETARYAIRFSILNQAYDEVASDYASLVEDNGATSRAFTADSGKISGIRYDGVLDEGIEGTLVIAKVNDKTLAIQSDSKTYADSFEKVLNSLRRGN